MRKDDLLQKTRLDLLEIARALGVKGRNAMNKDTLVNAIISSGPAEDGPTRPVDDSAKAGPAPARQRPLPPEEPQEDEDKWNSVALGRDPNYGRFLHPGSKSSGRESGRPVPNRGRALGPTRSETLAERSERGRMRASAGPQGAQREDTRRGADRHREFSREQGSNRHTERTDRGPRRGHRDSGGSSRFDLSGRNYRGYDPDYQRGRKDRGARADRSDVRRSYDRSPQSGRPPYRSPEPAAPDPPDLRPGRTGSIGAEGSNGTVPSSVVNEAAFSPGALPDSYGVDRCKLMVRDPRTLHVYWEIGEQAEARGHRELGEAWDDHRRILRVHGFPVHGSPEETPAGFFDVEIQPDAASAYIEVPEADRGYRVDMGLITPDNLFFPMASSNAVIAPRNGESRVSEERWMKAPVEGAVVQYGEGPSADEVSLDDGGHTRLAPPPVVQKDEAGESGASPGATSGSEEVPNVSSSPISAADWAAPSGRPVQPAFGKAVRGEAPGSAEAAGGGRRVKAADGKQKRDFRFELNTELVVYGSTEPDARVTIQGKSVELRADGTFTARFQFPDGTQILEVAARSADGKMRRAITPIVSRATRREKE